MKSRDILRKRLLYQSQHRGMREMDFLLGGFAQENIASMTQDELIQFERLLSFPEMELYGWFFEKMPFPPHAPASLIKKIKDRASLSGLTEFIRKSFRGDTQL